MVLQNGAVVSGGLGKAELAVFAEGGGEVALETAVAIEEGDLGAAFHEGGEGGAGEGAVALDDDTVYFDEGDTGFLFGLSCFFVFGEVDDEGVALFFDEGLLLGEVESCHFEFHRVFDLRYFDFAQHKFTIFARDGCGWFARSWGWFLCR